jgi:hypothetical protein
LLSLAMLSHVSICTTPTCIESTRARFVNGLPDQPHRNPSPVSKLLVAVQTELIQELAIQHIDFDALVQSEGCRYFLPYNAPWARTYRTEVHSQDGGTRRPVMRFLYGALRKPAFL